MGWLDTAKSVATGGLLGGGMGATLGGLGGGFFDPKQQTSTSTTDQGPWSATQPYWKQTYSDVWGNNGLLNNQMKTQNPYITQSQNQMASYATNPQSTALLSGAQNYGNRVLSGEMLDPTKNLALAQQLQRGLENMHSWDSQAQLAGRYGGGAWGAGRGRQLADLQGNLYGQGLQQMTQMSQLAPQLWQAGLAPSALLGQIGQQQEARPWNLYNQATSLLRGTGSSGTTTTPYYSPSTFQQLLGPAMAIGGGILGGPAGAAAGSQAGGMLGGGQMNYQPQPLQYQPMQLY